jgi:adenylate cyclase
MAPADFGRLINRFFYAATRELFKSNGMVEKLIGDAVTGFFVPGIAGPEHARMAVVAAQSILRATGHGDPEGPWVPVGVGVHTGNAYVGAVSSGGGASDISVLGDTANTGARLASLAGPGEVVLSEATRAAAGLEPEGIEPRELQLRGRQAPVAAWVIRVA